MKLFLFGILLLPLVAGLPALIELHDQTSYDYAPGQLSNESVSLGFSFNFTDVDVPQPTRGDYGADSLIAENNELNRQNPDLWAPPETDSGTVYNGA